MKIAQLRHYVYQEWQDLCQSESVVLQPDTFKPEIRQRFGDLRRKATWEQALSWFAATRFYRNCLDAWALLTHEFNFSPKHPYYDYRHRIFESFIAYEDGLDLIKLGLEQLLQSSTSTFTREEQEAGIHVLQELAQQTAAIPGLRDRSIRAISISATH